MHTADKLKVIEGINEKPSITKIGNQSLKTQFTCGCYFVQHGHSGKKYNQDINKIERIQIDRFFFVELCKTHLS